MTDMARPAGTRRPDIRARLSGVLQACNGSKRARLLTILLVLTPLIVVTKWFRVVDGIFTYDDFDLLAVLRTMPLAQAMVTFHGDVPLPLLRVFVAAMHGLFGVDEFWWNLFFLLLILAVNWTAVAILIGLGCDLLVGGLFYLTAMSAAVWDYTALGYYSMSIYPQIGLLGLIGVLAIVLWRNGGSRRWQWVALAAALLAPFIHPSGAYVAVAVGGFAYLTAFAGPDRSAGPLAMFRPELRWLTFGLVAALAAFALFFAWMVHGQRFLSMAHSPLTATAVARSLYFLWSQGMVLELLKPFTPRLLLRIDPATLGAAVFILALAATAAALRLLSRAERWTYLALLAPALANTVVVSFGRRLSSIEDVTNTAGKYNNFAYLWFAIATFYLLSRVAVRIPLRWQRIAATAAVVVVAMVFLSTVREPNRFAKEGLQRRAQMADVLTSFDAYAAAQPGPLRIPALDGVFIAAGHPLLHTYNLGHYRPFLRFDDRLTLLRNDAMQGWGADETRRVPSLRRAIEPSFREALLSQPRLQSLYFAGAELAPMDRVPERIDAVRLDRVVVSGAEVLDRSADTLSFRTTGGAAVVIAGEVGDPEMRHRLVLRIAAEPDRANAGAIPVMVTFTGDLPIPYKPNRLLLPAPTSDVAVDLLQVYAYALNERVGQLALQFPYAGRYTLAGLKFGR
jgi:hypothetical protein